jgi:hypothetical protein
MDSNLEDHAADKWRYACVPRPWIKTVKEKRPERVKDAHEIATEQPDRLGLVRRRTLYYGF